MMDNVKRREILVISAFFLSLFRGIMKDTIIDI